MRQHCLFVVALLAAFERQDSWSVHYEQCNYFSLASFARLFELAGFAVVDAGPCYAGDQYLQVSAVPSHHRRRDPPRTWLELPAEAVAFEQVYRDSLASWEEQFDQFRRFGRRANVAMTSKAMPTAGRTRTYTSGCPKNQNRCWNNSGVPPS